MLEGDQTTAQSLGPMDTPLDQQDHQDIQQEVQLSQLLENFAKNEPIFDNDLLYPTPKESEIAYFTKGNLTSATIEVLITHVTSPEIIDYQLLVDLFLTFRNFTDSVPLMELLLCRLTWCLRTASLEDKDNDDEEDNSNKNKSSIGKIALVRTFVCLRHWLLNHFQDDFISNNQIRQVFTEVMNEICRKEEYTSKDIHNSIQVKVLRDLKKVYIKLCNIYWNTVSLEKIESDQSIDLLFFDISPHISMSNARISMIGLKQINDPSTRRSGILSLVDQRASSSTNLLLKEHAEVMKDNNQALLETMLRSKNGKNKFNGNKKLYSNQLKNEFMNNTDKFILHPKASLNSLGIRNKLKDTAANNNSSSQLPRNGTLDNIFSNLLQDFQATPIQGVKRLSVTNYFGTDPDGENKENPGFITSGKLQVFKESKTTVLSPTTPLKKMSIKLKNQPLKPVVAPKMESLNDVKKSKSKRRTGLRSIFSSSSDKNATNYSNVQQTPYVQLNQNNNTPITNHKPVIEKSEDCIFIDDKIDLLSSRVIDEFHSLSVTQNYKKRQSTQLKRTSKQSVLSAFINLKDVNESHEEMDDSPTRSRQRKNIAIRENTLDSDELLNCFNINNNDPMEQHDTDNNNINADIVRMSTATFKTPSVTMNWSNSLDLSASRNDLVDIAGDDSRVDRILSSETDDYLENQHMISTEDVEKISLLSNDDEIDNNSNINDQMEIRNNNNRFSIQMISRSSQISGKSYVSYDSDFGKSIEFKMHEKMNDDEGKFMGQKLRKKNSFGDLRINSIQGAPKKQNSGIDLGDKVDENDDVESDGERYFDSCSNIEEFMITNVADSNIIEDNNNIDEDISSEYEELLKELPFFGMPLAEVFIKRSPKISDRLLSEFENSFSSEEEVAILPENNEIENDFDQNFNNHFDENEHESEAMVEANDDKEEFRYDKKESKEIEEKKSENSCKDAGDSDSTFSLIPTPTQSFMLPYPGFSSSAIAELANIPDDNYLEDPINTALSKLRGNISKKEDTVEKEPAMTSPEHHHLHHHAKVFYGLNDELSHEDLGFVDDHNAQETGDSDKSVDEAKLEHNVRDLFISEKPGSADNSYEVEVAKRKANKKGISKSKSRFNIKSLSAIPKRSIIFPSSGNKEPLSLKQVMEENKHIPFVLCYDSEILAEQLTLIERDSLIDVDWKTLLDFSWNKATEPISSWIGYLVKKENNYNSINLITSRFNIVTNWIISEIVLCRDLNIRIMTISRYIHLANRCKTLQNYATMFQIVLSLTSSRIKGLKNTWAGVDPGDLLLLDSLRDLTKPDKNFSKFRNEMNSVVASKGVIPFIGLHLSDLVMNEERKNFAKPKGQLSSSAGVASSANTSHELSSSPNNTTIDTTSSSNNDESLLFEQEFNYKLINIDKFRVSASILKSILRFIDWSKLYDFKMNEELLSKLLYITSLSDEEMDFCVSQLKDA